ncbi:VirB4 family type IV secretion system protein [Nocardiopsis sp. HUAS JQ3]|uniref:VirB4 family type IV secretion system protein n=1 Tax=Nocardiopsis sp. HUAS JQ3 TaxID=3061629 RepID=UPI0023AA07A2|nr:ATP-binding protein [Nocardiopsis sp. HUAS JQ3]WDZ90583.1 ATP-binding protein [Nocardiopsis sp. HUAS JQ3]
MDSRRLRARSETHALGGPTIHLGARHLEVEGGVCQTLAVTGYPREVAAGWAEPLLTYPGQLDISFHLEPVPAPTAAARLRKRRTRLESAQRTSTSQGRVQDPHQVTAAMDAAEIADRIATGQGRLFRVAVYVTVHAPDLETLEAELQQVRALCSSLLVDAVPATFRPLQGWISTLPLGTDALGMGRSMDTDAAATLLPFTSPELVADLGETTVVYGTNTHSSGLVAWDRFCGGLDNHNAVILARSGAGKSYLAKLEVLRSLLVGVEVAVIDPEGEYLRLAEAVDGTTIRLGTPEGRLNPFALPDPGTEKDGQTFTSRALFLHTLITAMVGELSPMDKSVLDRAIIATYAGAGITRNPATWARPAPVLADLAAALEDTATDPGTGEETARAAQQLADRLEPFVHGSHATLFNGASAARIGGHLTVISLKDLPDEIRSVGVLLALDAIWRHITASDPARPRMVVVDEAWLLLQDPSAARYLARLAKAGRKHWAGLTLITQDVGDVLGTELGRVVIANAATQILLKQAPQNLDRVTEAFHLSAGETHLVSTAPRGSALLVAGHQRVGFHPIASPVEHRLITSDPAEIAAMRAQELDEDESRGDGPGSASVHGAAGDEEVA